MAKTGHIVGVDPITDRIVILRKGQDGKAVRQVDVLDRAEAITLHCLLKDAIRGDVPVQTLHEIPTPEQVTLDLFATPEPERPTP